MTAAVPDHWPNRAFSQIRRGPVHEWHYQRAGDGPSRLLLLHGAGGSVHSFAQLFPLLTQHMQVVAVDLPGHGFTRLGAQRRSGLPSMAEDIGALCDAIGFLPDAILGHSAGGAVALQMAAARSDLRVVGLNPALEEFDGVAGLLFPAMARMLAAMPFSAKLFSGVSTRPARIKSLLDSTGSALGPDDLERYRELLAREAHVSGTLSMMAQWSLTDLLARMPDIPAQTLFITSENDQTVHPRVADRAARRLPNARVVQMRNLGHLLHEEAPAAVAQHVVRFLIHNEEKAPA